jgi:3-isopropylmalate/(R)-2-methylmalate dehydratase small subunit
MKIKGKTWKFGSNVNTDDIIPARYLNTIDEKELAKHCMESLDINFSKNVKRGDIIVADENFGCGSSREHAPIAIKGCGVSAVVAKSFARIFLRNSINIGLPLIEIEQTDKIKNGDEIEIDFENGILTNLSNNQSFHFSKYPEFLQNIIKNGGLMKWTAKKYIK